MKFLLDTHALLWWLFDDAKLKLSARESIADPANDIVVSAASAWEISTKYRLGKLPEAGDVPQKLAKYLRKARIIELPITILHAQAADALPGPHRDPFDRMLIAQAQLENMSVITLDPVFRDYGARVIW